MRDRLEYSLTLPRPTGVKLTLVDASGKLVVDLLREVLPSGTTTRNWDVKGEGVALSAGVYFLRLQTLEGETARPFVILR